ncbi:MAG: Lsr2 family protein [Actinomycetota bacterium]|nr:Lsr2 family protein [Actinomycetota bacterium]
MASKTIVELTDDLDGKKADETVSFAVDGVGYEIDLSARNAKALRSALADYITAGRRTRTSAARGRAGSPTRRDKEQTQAIREWARASGYPISDRGRISAEVVEAYDAAPNA